MQHRAVLGFVDLLTGEHCVAPPCEPGLFRQFDQQFSRRVIDPGLGVVKENLAKSQRKRLGALWIFEQFGDAAVFGLRVVMR